MPAIQISGERSGVGKTSLAGALLLRIMSSGKAAGYYKPFTASDGPDADATFVSESLLTGIDSSAVPAPVRLLANFGASEAASLAGEIGAAASGLPAVDTLIVEGPDLVSPSGDSWNLPGQVAGLLDTRVILVLGFANRRSAAATLDSIEQLGGRLLGIVINGVTNFRSRVTAEGLIGDLQRAGVPVLGMIPEDRGMLAVTVEQIAAHLGGHWVQDPEDTSLLIERFLIGGNIMDSGATYFGRYSNQAVITRAERPDIQLASLMEDTKCLVLTGTGETSAYIKAEAMQRDVPLIRVERDTLPTVEALAGLLDKATAHSAWKINRFSQLIQQHLDITAVEALL